MTILSWKFDPTQGTIVTFPENLQHSSKAVRLRMETGIRSFSERGTMINETVRINLFVPTCHNPRVLDN